MAQTGLTGVLSSGSGESVDVPERPVLERGLDNSLDHGLRHRLDRGNLAEQFRQPIADRDAVQQLAGLGIGRQPSRDLFGGLGGSVPSK